MALTLEQERRKRTHKGTDCSSVRREGEHQFYACSTHLMVAMADVMQGDDTVWVDLWSVPPWLINANQKIKCAYGD